MPLRKRGNGEVFIFPHQLTAAERTALKTAAVPDNILKVLQEHKGGQGVQATTLAFKKAAAVHRAKREMYEEALAGELAEEAYARRLDLEKELEVLRRENNQLARDNKTLNTKLGRATAAGALAESGEGTRQ